MESNYPIFSIVVPCYNHGEYLSDCLVSLLNQTFMDWEAVIIDDGSTDNTRELANTYSQSDKRFKYIFQKNQGLSAARNKGIRESRGDFLLFLDSDDWLESNCLSQIKLAIMENPSFELYRCGYGYWDKPMGNQFHQHLPSGSGQIYPDVLERNLGPCHSVLIRSEFANQLGYFDTDLRSCEDWDFWIRAGKMGAKIHSIPEVLVGYRYVPDSMSRNPRVMYDSLSEVSRRAGNIYSRLPESAPYNDEYKLDYPEIQKNHLIRMLGVMIHQGKVDKAINWYKEESNKWSWKLEKKDWKSLSTYLSWGYFFKPEEIKQLLQKTKTDLNSFFVGLGYPNTESNEIIRMVFEPQLKRRNHQRFGKYFGALLNRFEIY